jgi:hypothetical protein
LFGALRCLLALSANGTIVSMNPAVTSRDRLNICTVNGSSCHLGPIEMEIIALSIFVIYSDTVYSKPTTLDGMDQIPRS